ncbi:hypothetical protein V2A60_006089 [Cordyceps javanica]
MTVDKPSREEIVRQVHVWAAIREYVVETLPTGLPAVLRTDMPAGTWEYLGFEPTKAEFDAAALVTRQDKQRFLTVIAGGDMTGYREMGAAHGFDILAQEALMMADLSGLLSAQQQQQPVVDKTASFVKEVETAQTGMATRCRLTVTTSGEEDGGAGRPAAGGQIGIHEDMAVYDRIKTEEDMRRKGLGTLVMQTLTAEALAKGATTGWLIASPEGQKLYSRLGWEHIYWVLVLGNKDVIKNP